jgi:hypothetical protein
MNELSLNFSLIYNKNNIAISEAINALLVTVTGNGLNSLSTFSATTAAVAIPLGSSTSPGGWIFLQNLDPTNYVQVLTGTAGTVFARLLPGEFCLLRLDATVTAPAVQAHTSGCQIKLCLFDA